MCGICGIVSTQPVNEERLARAIARLAHRGPDDTGATFLEDGRVAFGHRRLSIIDLSVAGHQPMSSIDGSIWITFNGEIYNYKALRKELEPRHSFRSQSDTEVVINAYRAVSYTHLTLPTSDLV